MSPGPQAEGEDSWLFVRLHPLNKESLSRHEWGKLCNEIKDHHILLALHGSYFLHACACTHTCAANDNGERISLYIEKLLLRPKQFLSTGGSNRRT